MKVEQPTSSLSASPRRHRPSECTRDRSMSVQALSVSDVVATTESSEFDLDGKASMNPTPLCLVCLNDNPKTSKCEQIQSLASFTRT